MNDQYAAACIGSQRGGGSQNSQHGQAQMQFLHGLSNK
jgi:hypothetical protein